MPITGLPPIRKKRRIARVYIVEQQQLKSFRRTYPSSLLFLKSSKAASRQKKRGTQKNCLYFKRGSKRVPEASMTRFR